MSARTPTSPRLIRCPFCDKGRYSPQYLPSHIRLNHPRLMERDGPLLPTGGDATDPYGFHNEKGDHQ